ncbi:hypothetical protein DOM21_12295 [Bacteriovorax stolpii]|uniref:Uncharacterized protein n=1 Tax=Bacteriovorax stolpii TaxID=960 RepID=A0A2K9NQJ9_BACTC|nr:hypothetical protein [Bacteriovorax stolpii]AUN97806.1 hypothetical protein C0V70_06710 [Bacteriovorax stolpii]QDK42210.1 hypothetical protein DOM21_12295 [Bacteriovorax stolpii]TDP51629.1 hypothetical protein C8D79_3073 [Bacteriovorax stolpii]
MKRLLPILLLALTFTLTANAQAVKMLDAGEDINFNEPWYKKNRSDEDNFKRLVEGLKRVSTGKKVIEKATQKAAQQGYTLFDVVAIGDGSLTDTTLIRRFSASNPAQVMYETRSKVYLNKHLKTLDAMLDFAHELTHYTYREPFNPYDARFHLKDFIKSTVEGRGGEVDAYMVECKVLQEMLPGEGFSRSNCPKVYDQKVGAISKELGIQEFYKVGHHFDGLKKDLEKFAVNEKDIPQASGNEALFISSAWGLPYPVAAVKEYVNIMDRVCKNDQNRITLMQDKLGRAPASSDTLKDTQDFRLMFEDFKSRCDRFVSK